MQEVIERTYTGQITSNRVFIGQARERKHLELCQYIANKACEGYRHVRKTNDEREDCVARLYRAGLRNY